MTLHFCSYTNPDRQFLPLTCDKLMEWFFDSRNQLDYRVMSIADLKLDRNFADRLIEVWLFIRKN